MKSKSVLLSGLGLVAALAFGHVNAAVPDTLRCRRKASS